MNRWSISYRTRCRRGEIVVLARDSATAFTLALNHLLENFPGELPITLGQASVFVYPNYDGDERVLLHSEKFDNRVQIHEAQNL